MRGVVIPYLIVISLVIACDRPRPPAGRSLLNARVALIGPSQFDPHWPALQGGFRAGLRPHAEITVETTAPATATAAALRETVEEVLQRGPRVVCIVVANAAFAEPALKRCSQAGALTVTVGAATDEPTVFGHVEVEMSGGAELLGANLEAISGDSRTFLLLHENERDTVATYCYRRFSSAARAQYGMRLLEERSTVGETTPRDIIHEITSRYPHAGLVVTLTPEPWLTAPASATIASDARFATLSAVPALWPALRSGRAAAVVGPVDGEIGRRAAEIVLEALVGGESVRPLRLVRCELVTGATLDDFARRYAEAADMSFDAPASQPATAPTP